MASHLHTLTTLDLSVTDALCDVTLLGVAHLGKLEHLTSLELPSDWVRGIHLTLPSEKAMTDNGLAQLAKLGRLSPTTLKLRASRITDAGFQHILELDHLKHLDLSKCDKITDAGLGLMLSKLVNLKTLDLTYCQQVTGTCFTHLSKLHQLESLDLWGCSEVTDSALKHLTKLRKLARL